MTIGKKELNLRLAPETFGRNAALDPAQIKGGLFFSLSKRAKVYGWMGAL